MITFVTQHFDGADATTIGVSSDWRTAVRRIMEMFPDHAEYDKLNKIGPHLWEIRIDGQVVGLISRFVLNKRIS